MSRNRMIKPEFWSSEQVMGCQPLARLLFVGLWNFCDDGGRHTDSPTRLKAEVFPGDAFTAADLQGWLRELIDAKLVARYSVSGQSYLQVTGWRHQRIEKPTFVHPNPRGIIPTNRVREDEPDTFDDHSTNGDGTVGELSKNAPGMVGEHSTTIRPERKGKEGKEDIGPEPAVPASDAERFIFLTKGGDWALPDAKLSEYRSSFPDLDVVAEFRVARQWTRDEPAKRKQPRGMPAFLTRWLNNARHKKATPASNGKRSAGQSSWESDFKVEDDQ